MTWPRALLLALLLVPGLALLAAGGPARAGAEAALLQNWSAYEKRFITADGRVIDDGNAGISHSEGQGYALLLAAELDAPGVFARVWSWTRNNLLIRDDGLAAWRFDPTRQPPVTDVNNASDGDLLIAHALLLAGRRWQRPDYLAEARRLAEAIRGKLLREAGPYTLLLPGREGFERAEGIVVNPSYWLFASFRELALLDPDPAWAALDASGLALLRALTERFALIPDWVEVGAEGALTRPEGFDWVSGYNALRVPLYLRWAGEREPAVVESFARLWGRPGEPFPVQKPLAGDGPAELSDDAGFDALRRLLRCGRDGAAAGLVTPLPADSRYYPATLQLLSELVLVRGTSRC